MGNAAIYTYGELPNKELANDFNEVLVHSFDINKRLNDRDSEMFYARYKKAKKKSEKLVQQEPFSCYDDLRWVTTQKQLEHVSVVGHKKGKIVAVKSATSNRFYYICEALNSSSYAESEACLRQWDHDADFRVGHTLRFQLFHEKESNDEVYCINRVEIVKTPVTSANA